MALEPLEVNLPMIHQAVLDHQQMSGSEMCVCVCVCVLGGEGREAGRRDSLQRRREAFGGGGVARIKRWGNRESLSRPLTASAGAEVNLRDFRV